MRINNKLSQAMSRLDQHEYNIFKINQIKVLNLKDKINKIRCFKKKIMILINSNNLKLQIIIKILRAIKIQLHLKKQKLIKPINKWISICINKMHISIHITKNNQYILIQISSNYTMSLFWSRTDILSPKMKYFNNKIKISNRIMIKT